MEAACDLQDAVVIGGGFYGAVIAAHLARERHFRRVALLERESSLMMRASYSNQARVHNGYHYPRSFTTAYRSRVNLPRFVHDWPDAVRRDFTALYAIARRNSKVTARQFERFCREIDAAVRPADEALQRLFEPALIEKAFVVEEFAFDSTVLADWARRELEECGVRVRLRTSATGIARGPYGGLIVSLRSGEDPGESITSRFVFNCTYSGLNQLTGAFPGTRTQLKHEITEMALVRVPPELRQLGITVMDGPFFSMMPFPPRDLHTLSHVRYTPHLQWIDRGGTDPYDRLDRFERASRFDRMIRDVSRYVPVARGTEYVDSMFEVKTVLVKNEGDDGRPILFERHAQLPGCYSVLGGKIDNVYDVLERLSAEEFRSC